MVLNLFLVLHEDTLEMRNYQNLTFWQKSHQLTLSIYTLTSSFPDSERFGLGRQMRRSSASIPSNIAEGCGRNTLVQLKYFLQVASGSLSELQYQILLARDLGYISLDQFESFNGELIEIRKMIFAFMNKI